MKKTDIVVLDDKENQIPLELMESEIKKLCNWGKQLSKSNINRRGIMVLLKDATGIPYYQIERILNALPKLETLFLTGNGDKKKK